MKIANHLLIGGLALGTALTLPAGPASAQMSPNGQSMAGPMMKAPPLPKAPAPLPPALPGAQSQPDSAAPASRSNADMPPTEALFDSIDRGDLASTRDALNRGADLDARNVLGLSPLELSVDLGHHDITFLLLSMRGAGKHVVGAPLTVAKTTKPERKPIPSRRMAAMPAAPPPAPLHARLFAGDGGTPIADAGFLGFDQGRGTSN